MSKIKLFFGIALVISLFTISALSCTCVRDDLKARGFREQVFDAYGSEKPIKEPIKNATVRLTKGDQVVVEVFTDENGHFEVENVKSGNYILEVRFNSFETIFTRIKIRKPSRKKDNLLIRLEPATSECCEGEAKVEKAFKVL